MEQRQICHKIALKLPSNQLSGFHIAVRVSSLLEVKKLEAQCKYTSKEDYDDHLHTRHTSQKAMAKTIVLLNVLWYRLASPLASCRILNPHIHHITQLRSYQAVQCPCKWIDPAVPPPPYRNSLYNASNNCQNTKAWQYWHKEAKTLLLCTNWMCGHFPKLFATERTQNKFAVWLDQNLDYMWWIHQAQVANYLLRDQETREEIPEAEKGWGNCGSTCMIGCDGNCHHAIEREVHKCTEHEEEEPKELDGYPLEVHHGINDWSKDDSLCQAIWKLNNHLQPECFTDDAFHRFTLTDYGADKLLLKTITWHYLCQCIWQCRIHPSCPFTIEDRPFNIYNWLNCVCILYSKNCCCSKHSSNEIHYILLASSVHTAATPQFVALKSIYCNHYHCCSSKRI